jgi:DNA-binding transcriptional regulator YiaG
MTPNRIKEIRQAVGLTQTDLALVLGLTPNNGRRTVRRWEDGTIPITGPAAIVMQLIETGELPHRFFAPASEDIGVSPE